MGAASLSVSPLMQSHWKGDQALIDWFMDGDDDECQYMNGIKEMSWW